MDKIKELLERELNQISVETGFTRSLLTKDYYITAILYLIKDVQGMLFKGGTALQKTVLDYSRISEDIDFTLTRPLTSIKKDIIKILDDSKIFGKISKDKDVSLFTRLIVPYNTQLGKGEIFIDLNEKAKTITKPEQVSLKQFYPNIPQYRFLCLSQKEMIAEKIAAAIGRNKPRDHYDIYQIIKEKIPIDMKLVQKKCLQSGDDPSILKMFNKAKTLYKRWNKDMHPLIVENITFQEVMKTLADHFKLKEEKDKKK